MEFERNLLRKVEFRLILSLRSFLFKAHVFVVCYGAFVDSGTIRYS